ncbi:hypothetical protein H2204_006617 [Knufia peltigerae]|uniref:SWR1-complex protein 3 domain-containing protein n=1 Tax=Knufia peltigerae TaxID=1002370 RepID=A0AA38Y4L3_9EURO|nr:hypothetical protein H2204_006617 [Knufia peltigerae]
MTDPGPPRRTLPARDRGESRAKRRASSPAQPAATSTPRKPPTPTPSVEPPRQKRKYTKRASLVEKQDATEEGFSARFGAQKSLPTSREKPPTVLSPNEYQSVAESAVLAASLHRSRMQWLCEGVFKKYWVKPVKRKGVIEAPPNNPDVKSMQKLGAATITIEPHIFDVYFYIVRDPSAPQPYQRHANQHTAKHMIPPAPPYGIYQSPGPHTIPRPPAPAPPPSQRSTGTPSVQNTASQTQPTPPVGHPAIVSTPTGPPVNATRQEGVQRQDQNTPIPPNKVPVAPSTKAPTPTPQPPQRQPNPPPGPSGRHTTTDPVIQMLAARAASDPKLKELMKVVATSKASPEQLKEFQAHIDEFNEVVRRQESERRAKSAEQASNKTPSTPVPVGGPRPVQPESKPPTPQPATNSRIPTPSPAPVAAHPSTYGTPQHQARPTPSPSPNTTPGSVQTFPQTQAPGPAGYGGYRPIPPPPPPRTEPIIKHIVLEIQSSGGQQASSDRWLFPEYAVLELRQGGLEMLCSFLVERRGSEILASTGDESHAEGSTWKADQEYYEPVTMTVRATHHRTIETIARAAKMLPQVQEHMKNVLEKAERAPREYLVHQLPREDVGADTTEGFIDSGVELGNESPSEDDELKDVYGI